MNDWKGIDLVGNSALKTAIRNMVQKDRCFPSVLLTGDKGLGKKTAAQYLAAAYLCEKQNGVPCGECRSCRRMAHTEHPDFVVVAPSGKDGGYKSEEDLRPVVSQAYILPNEEASKMRVFLIADLDRTQPSTQNILLKLIEEPPPHAALVLTAQSKEVFLPTILSRALKFSLCALSEEETLTQLRFRGYEEARAQEAFLQNGGNLGRCLAYLAQDEKQHTGGDAARIAKALADKNEYALLQSLWALSGDKNTGREVLLRLALVLRDAAVLRLDGNAVVAGGDRDTARLISRSVSMRKIQGFLRILEEYQQRIKANASYTLCLNALCAEMMTVFSS